MPGFAQDRLGPVVEVARVELVAVLLGIDLAPAGQCPRRLADVALGVMTLAQGEELEELARQVLVGLGLGAVQAVEPAAHGTVAEHPAVQLADRRPPELALGVVLGEHQLGRIDLRLAGGVVAVPGQGHDLGQGKRREDQPVEPEHLHPLHGRPAPGRFLHGGDGVGELRGRLAARSLSLAVEDAAERGLEPVAQVALELAPGRPEARRGGAGAPPAPRPTVLRDRAGMAPRRGRDHRRAFSHSLRCSWLPLLERDRAQVAVLAGLRAAATTTRAPSSPSRDIHGRRALPATDVSIRKLPSGGPCQSIRSIPRRGKAEPLSLPGPCSESRCFSTLSGLDRATRLAGPGRSCAANRPVVTTSPWTCAVGSSRTSIGFFGLGIVLEVGDGSELAFVVEEVDAIGLVRVRPVKPEDAVGELLRPVQTSISLASIPLQKPMMRGTTLPSGPTALASSVTPFRTVISTGSALPPWGRRVPPVLAGRRSKPIALFES